MNLKNLFTMPRRYLAWKRGTPVPSLPPDRVYIETTNRCNLECPQCPTGLGITKRPKEDMDTGLFRKIVNETASFAETAVLHIWGEPLLNRNLESMIAYAAERGLNTEISSNAMLLDEDRAKMIIETGLSRIYLCIDGVDESTYSRIRVGGDFEKVKRNILGFTRLNMESGCPVAVRVQIIDVDLTRSQTDRFRMEWNRPGIEGVNIKTFDSWGGRVESINEMNRQGTSLAVPAKRYPCPNLWYHAHVFCDGSLVCCDRDFDLSNPLGNVSDGVMRTWRDRKMNDLRAAHASGEIETVPCKNCREWAWWKPGVFSSWGNAPKED